MCTQSPPCPPSPRIASHDAAVAKPLQKGQQTRAAILDSALSLASQMGLEGLSIGALAEVAHMSKSGVFAHFGSREELQIAVIREYHRRFEEEVFFPAMREPRGVPRLRALFERWLRRVSVEVDSGCIYISGAVEFDDRPGPVRDALVSMVRAWHDALERAIRIAIDDGQLKADTDAAADAVRDARPDPRAAPRRAVDAHARRAAARAAGLRARRQPLPRRRRRRAQVAPLTHFSPGAFNHAPVQPARA